MPAPSKAVRAFMEKYKIDSDEIWEVRPGTWAIKHTALERVGVENKIAFDRPAILEVNLEKKLFAMCVFGTMGDRTEWSVGESAPYNTKPGYPAAMAEKRARDRVILKLLNTHGAVYSESEADDFAPAQKRQNPHVTRPADILPETEYDEHGEIIDNIPHGDPEIERMSKAKAREDFAAAQREIRATTTLGLLEHWGSSNRDRVATYPLDWAEMIRGIYSEHRDDLRKERAA